MDGSFFPEWDLFGIDSWALFSYPRGMDGRIRSNKTKTGQPEKVTVELRNPRETARKKLDGLQDIQEKPKETSDALDYFARYFDQI